MAYRYTTDLHIQGATADQTREIIEFIRNVSPDAADAFNEEGNETGDYSDWSDEDLFKIWSTKWPEYYFILWHEDSEGSKWKAQYYRGKYLRMNQLDEYQEFHEEFLSDSGEYPKEINGKLFGCIWGSFEPAPNSYSPAVAIKMISDFGDHTGFSDEEVKALKKLKLGEQFTPEYGNLLIMRIQ